MVGKNAKPRGRYIGHKSPFPLFTHTNLDQDTVYRVPKFVAWRLIFQVTNPLEYMSAIFEAYIFGDNSCPASVPLQMKDKSVTCRLPWFSRLAHEDLTQRHLVHFAL